MYNIFLYSGSYPYGERTESFLAPELRIASEDENYHVTIIPILLDTPVRDLPKGVVLDDSICKASCFYKLKAFLGVFTLWNLKRTWQDRNSLRKFKYLFHLLKYVYAANLVYLDVKERANCCDKAVFYSYWMSYAPVAFGRYKSNHPQTSHRFVTRGHGGDVYTIDRDLYYPYREFSLSMIDHVYVVSKYGRDYIRNKYPLYKDKISCSYLGVVPNDVEKAKSSDVIKIVSCSEVCDIKRVDLIFRSLEQYAKDHPDKQFQWTHFGGGDLLGSVMNEINDNHHQNNLDILIAGSLPNEKILESYRKNGYHLFIHASTTEGLPVSMMEAISSSLPIVSTAVGGVPEIVTNETGRLLPVQYTQKDFDVALSDVIKHNDVMSVKARAFFDKYFNAYNNYRKFYKDISLLIENE